MKHLVFFTCLVLTAAACLALVDTAMLENLALRLAAPRDAQEKAALERLLTPGLLHIARYALAAGGLLAGAAAWMWGKHLGAAAGRVRNAVRAYGLTVRQTMDAPAWLVVGGATVLSAVLAAALAVHYDEAYSWLYFGAKGPLVAASLYNSTNNHVFFNVAGSLYAGLFHNPVAAVRVLSVVAGSALLVHTYVWLHGRFGRSSALTATVLMAASFPFVLYACQARGYMVQALCVALATTSLHGYLSGRNDRLGVFAAASILGAWTVPTMLYVFVPLVAGALVAAAGRRRRLLQAVAAVGVGVAVLYAPVLLVNGWDALHRNEQVLLLRAGAAEVDYPAYLVRLVRFFGWGLPLAVVIPGAVYLARRDATLYLPLLCALAFPLAVPLLQGVYPPERVFTFLLFPSAVVVAGLLEHFRFWKTAWVWAAVSLIGCLYRVQAFNRFPAALHNRFDELRGRRVYVHDHPNVRVLLLYHNETKGKPLRIDYSRTFSPLDETVLTRGYDVVFARLPIEGFVKKEFWYEK